MGASISFHEVEKPHISKDNEGNRRVDNYRGWDWRKFPGEQSIGNRQDRKKPKQSPQSVRLGRIDFTLNQINEQKHIGQNKDSGIVPRRMINAFVRHGRLNRLIFRSVGSPRNRGNKERAARRQ